MLKSFGLAMQERIVKEVDKVNYEYERTDENYDRFMSIVEALKKDPVLNISHIDELEELYNDRNNANTIFFKAGFDLAVQTLLKT